jgi:hypothetical protein
MTRADLKREAFRAQVMLELIDAIDRLLASSDPDKETPRIAEVRYWRGMLEGL